jgi:transcriptional regulator with XRE-family HTH domain
VEASSVGARIKQRREEMGMSLSRLSEEASVSKGYLWSLEKGETNARPSGETLYRIAKALGVTMSELLGRKLLVETAASKDLPPGLNEFAKRERLPRRDIDMLAQVNFRGEQPQHADDWEFVYQAIQRSVRSASVAKPASAKAAPVQAAPVKGPPARRRRTAG